MVPERRFSPEQLVGCTSREVIIWLIQNHPEIARLSLTYFKPREHNPPALEDKIRSGPDDRALFLDSSFFLEKKTQSHLFSQLENEPDWALGIDSRVFLKDKTRAHLQIVDFECQHSRVGQAQIQEFIKTIGFSGFLIDSGAFYHFIGEGIILGRRGWEQFLGRCLLSNLVDPRWVDHALDTGYATLRISGSARHPEEPQVIAHL